MIITSVRNGYIAQTSTGDYRIETHGSQRTGIKHAVFSPEGELLRKFSALEAAKEFIKKHSEH